MKKIIHTNTNVSPGSGEMVNRHTHRQKKKTKNRLSKFFFYFSLFIYFWGNITKNVCKQFEIERRWKSSSIDVVCRQKNKLKQTNDDRSFAVGVILTFKKKNISIHLIVVPEQVAAAVLLTVKPRPIRWVAESRNEGAGGGWSFQGNSTRNDMRTNHLQTS